MSVCVCVGVRHVAKDQNSHTFWSLDGGWAITAHAQPPGKVSPGKLCSFGKARGVALK